jgi:hypothetical protein
MLIFFLREGDDSIGGSKGGEGVIATIPLCGQNYMGGITAHRPFLGQKLTLIDPSPFWPEARFIYGRQGDGTIPSK